MVGFFVMTILYIVHNAENCCWSDFAGIAKQSGYVASSHAYFTEHSKSKYQVLCFAG
jgi:hypothetical protein